MSSLQANTENMLSYPQPMQHDLLNEQDQKLITDFFNSIQHDEPPTTMMDVSQHGVPNVSYGVPSHSPLVSSRGFQAGFGAGFEAASTFNGTNGFLYPMAGTSIAIPNNGYVTPNFQTGTHMHTPFVQSYPMHHQLTAPIHSGTLQHVGNGNVSSNKGKMPLYIKTEPSIPTRRQRSPSPPVVTNGTSSSSRQSPPKRSNSVRRSAKNASDNATPAGVSTDSPNQSGGNTQQSSSSSIESTATSSIATTDAADGISPKIDSQGEGSNQSTPTPSTNRGGRGKKGHHELLTEAEKKANHIASEQKRRQNIRLGFDQLVEIVPTLSQCHRSEALILQKSVEYIQQLLVHKNELKERVKNLQATLGDAPDHLDDSSSEGELDLIF